MNDSKFILKSLQINLIVLQTKFLNLQLKNKVKYSKKVKSVVSVPFK